MKPSPFHFLTGLLALGALGAQAQQRTQSEAATAEQRLVEDYGLERLPNDVPAANEARTSATLLQYGAGNTARVDQQNLAAPSNQAYMVQAGAANVLGIDQTGAGNSLYITQQGNRNRADFTQNGQGNSSTIAQRGNNNQLDGLVEGDRNTVNVRQEGNNNVVQGRAMVSDKTYEIKQFGNNNTLNQLETSTQVTKGYSVEMRGQGINLTIEQGKVR
jgi:minor curlin subunit